MKWSPLIEDTTKDKIIKKLSQISEILMEEDRDSNNEIGLLGGKMGEAVFLFYYASFSGKEEYYRRAYALIDETFNKVKNEINNHSLYNGLSGIGWALEHLVQNGFLEADEDILADLNTYLYDAMITKLQQYHYDLLQGALGCAQYFSYLPIDKKTKQYLIEFIKGLASISFRDQESGGVKWRDKISSGIKERNVYNLGLSHGIPGIIAFLSRMYKKDIAKEMVYHLLSKAVSYLLNQKLGDRSLSLYPAFTSGEEQPYESRLGWCYGDLGIAVALWQASRDTHNKQWKEEAVRILLHSSKRKNLKQNRVVDACFCHGTSGIAHIFNRMYHNTAVNDFKLAAIYWYKKTLEMAVHHDGLAGYKIQFHDRKDNHIWYNERNLLKGITGIGLALLAAVSPIEPRWDTCLMLS
jgi:lantibiotic modifying enzyme